MGSEIVIAFRDKGEGPPLPLRIRRLLKVAGRGLSLKCTGIISADNFGTVKETTKHNAPAACAVGQDNNSERK